MKKIKEETKQEEDVKVKQARTGKNNKRKGSNAERYYVNQFKEMGFDKCVTARYGSRQHDDAKIDLINIPYNVQVKAGLQRGMNVSKVLSEMQYEINEKFLDDDPVRSRVSVVIHKKEVGKGRKRNNQDEIVSLTFADFKRLIIMIEEKKKQV